MDYPKSVPGVGLVDGKFIDENTTTGQVGSLIPCSWGNAVTDELLNVIRAGGEDPVEGENDQMVAAIRAIVRDSIPSEQIRSTLAEYGITDAYTKTEIEDLLGKLSGLINQGNIDIAALALAVQNMTPMVSGQQIFSAAGVFDFVVPLDAKHNSVFEIEVWGGGGGGGGVPGDGPAGGGGGGGGYSYKRLTGLIAGSIIKVTVGAAGAPGVAVKTYGQPGGTSSFGDYLSATGGRGGASIATSSASVLGGLGVGGDLNMAGDCGGSSEYTLGGNGGMAPRGSGGGLGGYTTVGGAGFAPGGGGGGGDGGIANPAGGAGALGMVMIKWK